MQTVNDELEKHFSRLIGQLGLPGNYAETVQTVFQELAAKLDYRASLQEAPLLVSINGAQGTGKSTLTRFMKLMLEQAYQHEVASFSLDDFYLTRQQRIELAQNEHPLFVTRGVPGTHDVDLLEQVLNDLLNQRSSMIPVFEKAIDDRLPVEKWHIQPPADIILFEGWCNHSPPQQGAELEKPINQLEETEDSDGIWRQMVNESLGEYHERLYSQADLLVMLAAPDFEQIYEWRQLQEKKLRDSDVPDKSAVMTEQQVTRFIQHYERITRHTMQHLPADADILLPINKQHQIEMIRYRDDS